VVVHGSCRACGSLSSLINVERHFTRKLHLGVSKDTYSDDTGHSEEGGVPNVTVVVHEAVEHV
jgi:hypothetical protein